MADEKWAKGAWTFTDGDDRRHKEFAIMAKGGKVASVFAGFGAHFSWDKSEANARLMATAPELYEALKALTEWVGYEFDQLSDKEVNRRFPMFKKAKAALSKARGD